MICSKICHGTSNLNKHYKLHEAIGEATFKDEPIEANFKEEPIAEDVTTQSATALSIPAKIQRRRQAVFEVDTNASIAPKKMNIILTQNAPSKLQTISLSKEAQNKSAIMTEDTVHENMEHTKIETPPIIGNIVTSSTPSKSVKSDENPRRSTRRRQLIDVETVTSSIEFNVKKANSESISNVSFAMEEEKSKEIGLELKKVSRFNVDIIASTPIKMEANNESEQCDSAIARCPRNKQPIVGTTTTPKCTQRKNRASTKLPLTKHKHPIADICSNTPQRTTRKSEDVNIEKVNTSEIKTGGDSKNKIEKIFGSPSTAKKELANKRKLNEPDEHIPRRKIQIIETLMPMPALVKKRIRKLPRIARLSEMAVIRKSIG